MPQLFALQSSKNCGRTTILKLLFDDLQTKYPSACVQIIRGDTKEILVIMKGIDGFSVGIESQGGPDSRLRRSLIKLSQANCDIIFCACRTRGITVEWINDLSPPYSIQFIEQMPITENYAAANMRTVKLLMDKAGI